jgi:hypothetical protein
MASQEEEELRMRQFDAEVAKQMGDRQAMNQYATTMFAQGGNKQNLIEWELDFKPELENIERLLRCDILMKDKDGNEYWAPNPDNTKVFFNEQGVSDLIRNIIILVNKNKALSRYTAEEINDRVKQIKHELRILIYNNYEEYGLDNEYKMNNYSMIVLSVGSIIEDVYRRAMEGATHKGLNEQRIVQQSEPLMGNQQSYNYPSLAAPKKGGIGSLLPWNWGRK